MIQLVPNGIDIVPPKQNVSKFGLQRQQDNNNDNHNNNSRRQQQTKEKLNFLYYMLDETDGFNDEGILLDDYYPTSMGSTSFGVFD
jgi:hypothetical protein